MKKTLSIINTIHANNARIKEIDVITKPLKRIAEIEENMNLFHEEEVLRMENKILYDNARRALFDFVYPHILDIMKKYENKPYGEKTRSKIKEELYNATKCWIYFDIDEIGIMPETKTFNYNFSYDAMRLYTVYKPELNHRVRVLNDNKIQVVCKEDLTLSNCREYVKQPRKRAEKILTEFAKLKAEKEKFEKTCEKFNAIIPSGIDRYSLYNFRNYLQ